MSEILLQFEHEGSELSVRRFHVRERMSAPFEVRVTARSPNDSLDPALFVGRRASLSILPGTAFAGDMGGRWWTGVCRSFAQSRVEGDGLSTYELEIVPNLWLLGLREDHRLFQHETIPAIVDRILREWGIVATFHVAADRHPRLELRTQYGEGDLAFVHRLLEEAGISYRFLDDPSAPDKGSQLVLTDAPTLAEPRVGGPIPFVDAPEMSLAGGLAYLTEVRFGQEMRFGQSVLAGFDFRRPNMPLRSANEPAPAAEARHERYRYEPGAFSVEAAPGDETEAARVGRGLLHAMRSSHTPAADDQGVNRHDVERGSRLARESLDGLRTGRLSVGFATNVTDLRPGTLFSMTGHAHRALHPGATLMVTELTLEGAPGEEWKTRGTSVFASEPYRPARVTPRPTITALQSAIVVGPAGEEIHTDEHGRVRVQFPWDREGKNDERSSPWIRVSQGWSGEGYGLFTVPRVGHEVLVAFLNGDVDQPIVVGRVFNGRNQVPHKLPENRTVSTWKSESTPGGGGFNELRFEDAKGREHVYIQAEKDLDTLVKHNEMTAVGRDRTRVVHHDETVAVGHDRTQVVGCDAIDTTGQNRVQTVGINQVTTVGVDDAHLIGSKYSVTVARGMSADLAMELTRLFDGPLGPVLKGLITNVLGVIPGTPLGGLDPAALLRGHLDGLSRLAPSVFKNVLSVLEGITAPGGPPPTSFEMVDRRITLSTGEASIVLDGPNITIQADGNVMVQARNNVGVLADNEGAFSSDKKLLLMSQSDDLLVIGGPNVHLNPLLKGAQVAVADQRFTSQPEPETQICSLCGGQMVKKTMPDGRTRLACERERHADGEGGPLPAFDADEAETFEGDPDERDGLWAGVQVTVASPVDPEGGTIA